jgi:hypothetical protein
MENYEQRKVSRCGNYTALKIISVIVYVLTTLFLLVTLITILNSNDQNIGLSLAVFLIIHLTIFGSIGHVVASIISAIGLAITLAKRERKTKRGQIVCFAVLTALPVLTQALFYLAVVLLA